MSNSLLAIAIDCADAPAVARSWADVLGRQVAEDSTSQHVILLPGDGGTGGPRITFNKVPEPKTVKNRLHLDVISDTFAAEIERLLGVGVRRVSRRVRCAIRSAAGFPGRCAVRQPGPDGR